MTVRVRMAPAPSGSLHVGNVRTFLFNWLFARNKGGVIILRIEDTDKARFTEEAYRSVLEDLRWLGLDWDEGPEVPGEFGPYRQSEREDSHGAAAASLLESGAAYRCYCTPEELGERRKAAEAEKRRPGYDGRCYLLSDSERADNEAAGKPSGLRFHVPDEGVTVFHDLVVGDVEVQNDQMDDFVIARSDGSPLYQLGVVVDDAAMQITHVIRGDDHLSNTPRQILLHRALGNTVPEFAHVPQVVGDQRPLGKRHGSVSVEDFRDEGFLPEAMLNYMALLGWGTADETIMSKDDLISRFDIGHVHASPARLDVKKLDWMNGEYVRGLSDEEFEKRLRPWLKGLVDDPPSAEQAERLQAAAPLLKTRIKRLEEAASYLGPVLNGVEMYPAAVAKGLDQDHVPELLRKAIAALEEVASWDKESVEATLRAIQQEMDLKPKTAFLPFFVAITGSTVGLPIFDVMAIIGKQISLERLRAAMAAGEGLEPSTF